MPIDSLMVDAQVPGFVQPHADAPIAELRVFCINLINHSLDAQVILCGGRRFIVQAAAVQVQKFRLFRNRNLVIISLYERLPFCYAQLTGQLFF